MVWFGMWRSHTVLVQHLGEGVPHLLRVGVEIEHVSHHIPQPVIRKFLEKHFYKKKILLLYVLNRKRT
jgi:hypothetical protein